MPSRAVLVNPWVCTAMLAFFGAGASSADAQRPVATSPEVIRLGGAVLKSATTAPALSAPYATVDGSNDASMLGDIIDARILADGRTVVLDQITDNVHVIGADGRYQGTWGRRGQGPQEFENVERLSLTGDSLIVIDQGGLRASVMSPAGKIVRRTAPTPGASMHARMPGRRWLATFGEEHTVADETRLDTLVEKMVMLNDSGRVVDSLGRYVDRLALLHYSPKMTTLVRLAYSPRGNVAASDRWVAFHSGLEYRIDLIEIATGRRRRIEFDAAPAAMTSGAMAEITEIAIQRIAEPNRPATRQVWDRRPQPATVAAFTGVMIAPSGQIWAGLVDSPATTLGGGGAEHWLVLDESGRTVRSVSLQPREHLLFAGDSSLVVVSKDEDDVQSIRFYRLPRR